jgi:hypothetical protein
MAAMVVRVCGCENERGVSEGKVEGKLGRLSSRRRGTDMRRSMWQEEET